MNGILQEKHGKYYVVLDYKTADGTRKRKWVNTGLAVAGNNIRAAKKRLTEILVEYQNLEQYIQNPNSFTEYAKDWLERELEYIDKATWNGYRLTTIIFCFAPHHTRTAAGITPAQRHTGI